MIKTKYPYSGESKSDTGLSMEVIMSIAAVLMVGLMSITGIWSRWDTFDGRWDEIAPLLDAGGFDTVFYMAAYGTVIDEEGLQECLDACRPLGIDVHAWVVMWKTNFLTEREQESLLQEGRMQVDCNGEIIGNRLDPADLRNVKIMAETCLRIAGSYPVTGIHLDFVRYINYQAGYSTSSRERFQDEMNLRSISWPDDCISGGRYYDRFMEWRAGRMTDAVRTVRDSLDRINRVIQLSAAVMPNANDMIYFGQMWDRWLNLGLIDYAVTMNYTLSDSQFTAWGNEQIDLAGDNTILCGIGVRSSVSELNERETIHQTVLARDLGFDGSVIYRLCEDVIDRLNDSAADIQPVDLTN